MQKLEIGSNTIWISDDHFQESCTGENIRQNVDMFFDVMSADELHYVNLYGQVKKTNNVACLYAHGDVEDGVWYYYDGERRKSVDGWLRSLRDSYKLVMLIVCNPGAFTPKCKHLLLLPDGVFSFLNISAGFCNVNLVHPEEGDLDYTLEYETKKLENVLKQ